MPKKNITTEVKAKEYDESIGELITEAKGIKIGSKGWKPEYSAAFGKLGGRPVIQYNDMLGDIVKYAETYEKLGDVVPSVGGLCSYLGIDRATLKAILGRIPEAEAKRLFAALKSMREKTEHILKNKALKGETKERFTMFLLNIEHQMIEKKQTDINLNASVSVVDALKATDKDAAIDVTPEDEKEYTF